MDELSSGVEGNFLLRTCQLGGNVCRVSRAGQCRLPLIQLRLFALRRASLDSGDPRRPDQIRNTYHEGYWC